MKKMDKIRMKQGRKIIVIVLIVITMMLVLEYYIQTFSNQESAQNTSRVMLDQVISVLEQNQRDEDEMLASLKEDYSIRAKAAAYIIDHNKKAEKDVKELSKIVELLSVDEIHLFDKKGTLYSGSVPEYYGLNFEDGDQVQYFKPMLKDKSLTMCQDITPNTMEGKRMMYAITWNSAGDKMVQIGVEPVRLLKQLRQNEIDLVVKDMPMYEGLKIYVANVNTGEIYGATDVNTIGKTLDEIGLEKIAADLKKTQTVTKKINGKKNYCTLRATGNYVVGITFDASTYDKNILLSLMIVLIYLSVAASVIVFMLMRLLKSNLEREEQLKKEETLVRKSNTDELTGCFNRRAYEDDILEYPDVPTEQDFTYISLDVNGLKVVNDTYGHAAGDELIRGAVECMNRCIGNYGRIYRTGGDEFVAMIFADEQRLEEIQGDFKETVFKWSGDLVDQLAISAGYVTKREFPTSTVVEMAEIADQRMYEDKANYYRRKGVDRRGQQAAHTALCNLYTKILRINLTEDSYQIINMDTSEQTADKGFADTISSWLKSFGQSGQVHPEDLEQYLQETDIESLREYFNGNKTSIHIYYRRKFGDEYKQVMMEMIPADDYAEDNQSLFLYVKSIDK